MIEITQDLNAIYKPLVDANNRAYDLVVSGRFADAIPYIETALKYADLQKPAFINDKDMELQVLRLFRYLYHFAGYVYGNIGNEELALLNYQKGWYLYWQIKMPFPKGRFATLYQFRHYDRFDDSQNFSVENLREYQITLSDPRIQNDIVDCPIYAWLDYCLDDRVKYNKHFPIFRKAVESIRMASFCANTTERNAVENSLMWSHYADSHKGFCIEYRLDESMFKKDDPINLNVIRMLPIEYRNPIAKPLDFSETGKMHNGISIQNGFFCKSKDWGYESEVRIVSYSPFNHDEYRIIPISGNSKIKAIYFGVRCPKETIEDVQSALNGHDVKYFQMYVDIKNIHILKYEEL